MSLYYNNSKYDLKVTPDMIDMLLNPDTISKYVNENDISRLIGFLPEGVEVFFFNLESYRIYKKYFK
jgi:hypothetical protein